MDQNNNEDILVVVPDGLRINKNNKSFLTNTFCNVLKNVLKEFDKQQLKILLLPANNFGSCYSEEDIAEKYLLENGIKADFIIIGIKTKKGYLDTIDNFREVLNNGGKLNNKKIFVTKNFVEGRYKLFTSHLHADRVINAIKLLGIRNPNEVICSYANEDSNLPIRLIHYKYPIIRYWYEFGATLYQVLRVYVSKILFKNWRKRKYIEK